LESTENRNPKISRILFTTLELAVSCGKNRVGRLAFRTLVKVAIAYPSSPISNPSKAQRPNSRNFGSAAHPPIGVLITVSVTFSNPEAAIMGFIDSDIWKVQPVRLPACSKSCGGLVRINKVWAWGVEGRVGRHGLL
jgi:hypothetical protein